MVLQQAFHLPVDGGECYCVYRFPDAAPIAATVLHLPAFGDEMTPARAMTAGAARALAARGCGVLQIDLIGCGDSSGDHADATFLRWGENALRAIDWLREHAPAAPTPWLWPLRSGALLVAGLLEHAARAAPLLLWQPRLSGAQQLNHLLRQRLAGELAGPGRVGSDSKALRARWRGGETLEIGGYAVSARLAEELERSQFELPPRYRGTVAWLEVTTSSTPSLSAAARSKVEAFRAAGVKVSARALQGPGFWQSVEIERCAALIDASVSAITTGEASVASRDAVVL